MSKEELKYIFSESACLTPKQMKSYVRGSMTNEESYAVELHLNSCAFCNEAIEGLFEQQEGSAAEAVVELDTNFLKEHFSLHNPQVHLNSMAPAQAIPHSQPPQRKKLKAMPFWRPSGIAAVLLLGIVIVWYYRSGPDVGNRPIAEATSPAPVNTQVRQQQPAADIQSANKALASAELVEVKNVPVVQQNGVGSTPQAPQQPQQPIIIADNSVKQLDDAKAIERKDEAAKKQAKEQKQQEDVVVTAYKVPLIDKYDAAPRSRSAEDIEKMPARTTNSVAATSAGAYKPKDEVMAIESLRSTSKEVSADDLYSDKKYSAALKLYKEQMNSGSRAKRNYAAIQAARCHLALGSKQSAIKLLQGIVEEGGAQKRAAKRMLEDLGMDKEED